MAPAVYRPSTGCPAAAAASARCSWILQAVFVMIIAAAGHVSTAMGTY